MNGLCGRHLLSRNRNQLRIILEYLRPRLLVGLGAPAAAPEPSVVGIAFGTKKSCLSIWLFLVVVVDQMS